MAKRFTDTNKYKKPFTRSLQGAYKLLWDYLYHECDHAGIWIVDFEIAQMYLGADMKISKEKALSFFNPDEVRVVEIDNGKQWFLPGFIEFQYGKLNPKNRVHESVISILHKHNLLEEDLSLKQFKPLISPLQGVKDKDKYKEQEKDKDKLGEFEILDQYTFEEFWDIYDKKKGPEDCRKKFNKLTEKEKELIWMHIPKYVLSTPDKQYRLNPLTYINGKHWNDEIIIKNQNNSFNGKPKQTTFDKLQSASEEARRIREERRAQSDSNGEESGYAHYTPVD